MLRKMQWVNAINSAQYYKGHKGMCYPSTNQIRVKWEPLSSTAPPPLGETEKELFLYYQA